MAFAHVVLSEPVALAGQSYRASFRIGHGCNGSATTGIRVLVPAGFLGTKPIPKAGWDLSLKTAVLPKPYVSHGKTLTEDVSEVSWSARSKADAVQDAWTDEFVLWGGSPAEAQPLWFKVIQTCEQGHNDWVEIPATGTSTKGLKAPAALLELVPSGASGEHQH